MKKILKAILFTLSFVLLSFFGIAKAFASTAIKDKVAVTLEQQESINDDKIRYVSTLVLSDGATLADITKIDVEFSLSKAGEETRSAEVSLTSVYDSVVGAYDQKDNTYYAVFTVTDLSKARPLWTLSATFEYNYTDGTEKTNTITYTIPMPKSYQHVLAKNPTCGEAGNYEYYYNSENSTYYDHLGNTTTLEALTIPKTNAHSFDDQSVTPPTRTTAGSVTYTCSECNETKTLTIDALGTTRVYFTNNQGWSNVNAYIYNSNTDIKKAWPGEAMTYLENNEWNQGIYYIDYNVNQYTYIIFNGSGGQTVDISVDKVSTNAYYLDTQDSEGKWTVGTWSKYSIPSSDTDNHHWNSGVVTKAPTCTEVGYKTYTCTDSGCGETKVEIIPATGHTWDSGVVTKAPTESTTGEMTYTCTVCGETKVEVIPVSQHTHNPGTPSYSWSSDHLSCYGTITCTICGEVLEYESVVAQANVTKTPTCLATGTKVYTTRSFANSAFTQQTYTETLPKADHTIVVNQSVTTAPTCTESGISTYTVSCSVCHETLETREMVLDALGHTYNSTPTNIVVPTRTTAGSATYTCSTCGHTKVKTIPALGTNGVYFTNNKHWDTVYVHPFTSGNVSLTNWPGIPMTFVGNNGDGDGVYYAEFDITHYTKVVFNNGGNGLQTVDVTLDQVSTNAYYLSSDSSQYTVGTWAKYSIPGAVCDTHTWSSQVTTPATATTEGVRTYTCTVCGETYTEVIPMTGHTHNYNNSEYAFSSDYHYHNCTVSGCSATSEKEPHDFELIHENNKYYNVCSVCGYVEEVTIAGLKLHYYRADGDYSILNSLWIWGDNLGANLYTMTSSDSYGRYYTLPYSAFAGNDSFGVIIKCQGADNWSSQDGTNKYFTLSQLKQDNEGYYHVYFVGGAFGVYASVAEAKGADISYFCVYQDGSAYFLKYALADASISWTITKNGASLVSSGTVGSDSNATNYGSTYLYYKLGTTFPTMNDIYELNVTFADGRGQAKASMWDLYDLSQFESVYGYSGSLGAIYTKSETTFKVWSPVATSMKLRIYNSGTPAYLGGNDSYTEYDMTGGTKASHGVWTYTLSGDQGGKYYTYVVSNYAYTNKEVVDPYAKSTGVNGLRGMVVDFASVNPDGWDDIETLNINPQNLAVYEAHIADLTSSSTWGGTAAYAKTFKGFAEEGTTYTSGGKTVTTGFDHIKELGVNAVQLLPIFDSSNDEINPSFNWGYNPLNYNSLDGSYSTNPYDGYEKIREFKELVYKYNKAGITIIMDVVFNHVSDAASANFTYLVPGYYFRYTQSGYLYNGSGCGNETASDRLMYHKFMIDSTEFWATEYKLGGFRFDLMGIHDVKTMQDLADNLHTKINPNIVVYGEPWAASGEEYVTATLVNLGNYSTWGNFGSFNSTIRDSMYGQVGTGGSYGWASTTGVDSDNLYRIMNGSMGYMYDDRANPVQYTVAYISCHDNYNVADHLETCGITGAAAAKASTLGHAIVLTSQGISFIQEGEEFLRTKDLNENSYNASYAVNDLDYSYKVTYNSMFQNFKKLVALKTSGEITVPLSEISAKRNTIAYDQSNFSYFYYTVGDYVIMHHNGNGAKLTVSQYSGYSVYLDTLGYMSGTISGSFELNPYQTVILKRNS